MIKMHGIAHAVGDLIEQGAPALEAAVPMLSQLLKPRSPSAKTIVAIRCNPAIRPFYKHLREQGKPPKVAIVAAMRKLITAANSMLTYDRPWRRDTP